MSDKNRLTVLVVCVCAVLVIVGFVFSFHVEQGISHAAHLEATQQSPVPTPASFRPAPHKAS